MLCRQTLTRNLYSYCSLVRVYMRCIQLTNTIPQISCDSNLFCLFFLFFFFFFFSCDFNTNPNWTFLVDEKDWCMQNRLIFAVYLEMICFYRAKKLFDDFMVSFRKCFLCVLLYVEWFAVVICVWSFIFVGTEFYFLLLHSIIISLRLPKSGNINDFRYRRSLLSGIGLPTTRINQKLNFSFFGYSLRFRTLEKLCKNFCPSAVQMANLTKSNLTTENVHLYNHLKSLMKDYWRLFASFCLLPYSRCEFVQYINTLFALCSFTFLITL